MSVSLSDNLQVVGQAISKLRGGATEREVLDWLREEFEVAETVAGGVVARARVIHLRVIRVKSIALMVLSVLGMLAALGLYFYFTTLRGGMGEIGYGWMLILSMGIVSGTVFLFSLVRFLLALN